MITDIQKFASTHKTHEVKTKFGTTTIQRGYATPSGENCVLVKIPGHAFLLSIEGSKALAEALLFVVSESHEDPSQTKLGLD